MIIKTILIIITTIILIIRAGNKSSESLSDKPLSLSAASIQSFSSLLFGVENQEFGKWFSLLCISRACWLNWEYMFSFEKAEIPVGKVNWTVQQKLFEQNQLKSRIEKDRYNWQIEWNRADHRHPSVVLRCRPWGVRSDCRSCGIIPSDSRLTKCFLIPIIVIIIIVITRIISSS